MTPPDRAALVRVMADAAWQKERGREITEYWRHTTDYNDMLNYMADGVTALEAAGVRMVPAELTPTIRKALFGGLTHAGPWNSGERYENALNASPYRSET